MDFLINLIYDYGLIAMFFIILLEYACFPVSSEIILPFSGAIASVSSIPFILILIVSILAGGIGTSICYFIGKKGGTSILSALMKKFPKTQNGINSSIKNFEKYGTYAVCIGRMIPLVRTYIAFVAGTAKQNYIKFLSASVIGIAIWNSLLIGLGYTLRENWKSVISYYEEYKHFLIPAVLIVLAIIFLKIRKKRGCRFND